MAESTESNETPASVYRSIRHEYTRNLGPILDQLGGSLLVSTYQAGKVAVVAPGQGGSLDLTFRNFDKAMGMAIAPGRIAVGARGMAWILRDEPPIARRLEPAGSRDACYLARSAIVTGEIFIHEMAWSGESLWAVNTLFSCLCNLDPGYAFIPRWKPPFISALAAEDRCHLNGMAFAAGSPRFVTALGRADSPGGWRPGKVDGGVVIDVASGETAVRGLCMPHSPRLHAGRLWVLDSGRGRLVQADPATGELTEVAEVPGYARGLAFDGPLAFVGLSRIRETSTFGGLPIAERRGGLKCGVAVVDLRDGRNIGLLEFQTGVDEIFDVQVLPGVRSPAFIGPHPELDETPPIWKVAQPRWLGPSEESPR
ncbi:TIGR03032 family protein [Aquisphaera insulae]|uniref:TIGR03032 family protein n=1 Tax=Aquisphaera insulae TaxID=2712864 RepID=UPI0013EA4178|nr:TIGR03032 family protein [Aquisphaera insulae]